MKIQIDDEIRNATSDEKARIEAMRNDAVRIEAEKQAARDALRQKLSALGLTETDIAALIGG